MRRACGISKLIAVLALLWTLYVAWKRYVYTGWLSLQYDYRGPPDPRPEGVLLVSAYFPFPSAKHSQDEYNTWIGNFLSQITSDIYFFTTPEMEDTIRSLRGNLSITINTHYKSPYEIEPLQGRKKQIEDMYSIDREQSWHNPDLYAIWAAKPFFVNEALHHVEDLYFRRTQQPFPGFRAGSTPSPYKYVFWADSGSFRDPHPIHQWPYVKKLDEVWKEGARVSGTREEDLLFIPIQYAPPGEQRDWNELLGPVDADLSQGSFFGGHPEALHWWYRVYFAYFHHYADQGIFVGKDQTLINALLYLFRDRIINVWVTDPDAPAWRPDRPLGDCSETWWYYIYWLATPREQLAQARIYYNGGSRCRLTRVVAFSDVLWRTYGRKWIGPSPALRLIEDN